MSDVAAQVTGQRVNIRPGVSILSVLRHLNYKPWFALAEFVDNSVQSYLENAEALNTADGPDYRLRVAIEFDDDGRRIVIRDNAAGIHQGDYARAFRPAQVPPDRSGLAEFGRGLKSASCWFAPRWAVRTSALGEGVERRIAFDIEQIVHDQIEELVVSATKVLPGSHYTEIVLSDVFTPLRTKTITKVREHLGSIYRVFLRSGVLQLWFNGSPVSYEDPPILVARYFKEPSGEACQWRKTIALDFGMGQTVKGFAALRETGSTSEAGLALFRRDRLVQGSREDAYRPPEIFGSPNSFTYQRLFGELHLVGFEVSHTKDGFQWEEHEEIVLEALKDQLEAAPLSLLSQAEGFRSRVRAQDVRRGAELAAERTAETLARESAPIIQQQLEDPPEASGPATALPEATLATRRVIEVHLDESSWKVEIELSTDPAVGDWVGIYDQPAQPSGGEPRTIGIRVALAHPFMERFGGTSLSEIEPLLRVAVAIVIAEVTAREGGMRMAGTLRRNINQLLREALAKP